ncbi:MAG: hypothetical protein ACSHXH_11215 [Marivita sp.]|uniref:hypothetical protein n=1 Tax=Marivita sp. TaxID=2003365 RepID=UPI003EF11058
MEKPVPDTPVIDRPVLTFPEEVSDWVRELYARADVILEYGSGGSTVLASEMAGKTVYSVESDPDWCQMMQVYFDHAGTTSDVTLHYANVGPVGKWGRPKTDAKWARYHRYPNSVWDLDGFKAPDLVLVDGRFRTACVLTAMLRTEKPVTVLFDDYIGRSQYQRIERFVKPVEMRGRMARFEIEPTDLPKRDLTEILTLYTKSF